jgi:molybdopterin molybdotransferase
MDGFAVKGDDVEDSGAVLSILEDVAAGQVADATVAAGQAIRIMTGAPMPEGADTVVRVEETTVDNGSVSISTSVARGTYVRPAGGDVAVGQTVFDAGVRMGPMHIGVLATLGHVAPVVSRRPKVAIMSTGDELQPPETRDLTPGMIRDSNRPMLRAILQAVGVEILDMGTVPDDADALRAALGRSAADSDLIVTTGGVSMGDYDVTKIVLKDEGSVDFISVAMKPGKPFAFGKLGGTPFFGLPGNPVSVLVSFEQFVRPALLSMQGADTVLRPQVVGIAGENLFTDPEKTVFVRVQISYRNGEVVASPTGSQASNVLSGAAAADAFAVVPRGVAEIEEGQPVTLELFRALEMRKVDDAI